MRQLCIIKVNEELVADVSLTIVTAHETEQNPEEAVPLSTQPSGSLSTRFVEWLQ